MAPETMKKVDKKSQAESPGGIDLNATMLRMDIQRDSSVVAVPVLPGSPEAMETWDVDGFVPVIINVIPVTNLPLLLGLNK